MIISGLSFYFKKYGSNMQILLFKGTARFVSSDGVHGFAQVLLNVKKEW